MAKIAHILAATDLTDRSERALERAIDVWRRTSAPSLTALHVVDDGLPAELVAQQQAGAEACLATRLAEPRSAPSPATVDVSVRLGAAFSTIVGEAIKIRADLIVIGAPRRHAYSDIFMSTTAERVIRFSDRPVLMVKQPAREPYRRVLAAFDGSEGATRALQMALALAPDADLRVVHAWWPPRGPLAEIEAVRQAIAHENQRLRTLVGDTVTHAIAGLDGQLAKLTIDMTEGNPYVAITNASSWADLLVIGTHSKGRLASATTTGSLARHLLIESSCDVLVSRP